MYDHQWKQLNHFNKNEAWGDPNKMNYPFLCLMDSFRNHLGIAINVLNGYCPGSVPGSSHPYGIANDVFIDCPDTFDLFIEMLGFHDRNLVIPRFGGIGVYLGVWKYKGRIIDGFHLDGRIIKNNKVALWGGLQVPGNMTTEQMALFYKTYPEHKEFNRTDKQIYVPMDSRFWMSGKEIRQQIGSTGAIMLA